MTVVDAMGAIDAMAVMDAIDAMDAVEGMECLAMGTMAVDAVDAPEAALKRLRGGSEACPKRPRSGSGPLAAPRLP